MRWVLPLCLLTFAPALRAEDAAYEIPAVGRPADLPFSGASGDFRVRASAAPTTLEAETPFTLTLIVEAVTAVRQPPRRIDLREAPAFAERFRFLESAKGDDRRPNERTWEFVYRLQPKRQDVTAVPGAPFVFFNPEIQYPRKGFQVAYTDAIPLTVRPHDYFPVAVAGPDVVFGVAGGPPIQQRQDSWAPPGPATTVFLVMAPPVLCAAWYLCWRRLYPDAARIARQRRSLAARRALQALRGSGRLPAVQRATRVAAVAAEYLRTRFDATVVEPTPGEAAACLGRAGCPAALADVAAALFRACDAVRFGPGGAAAGADLPEACARFILAVEAETWSASRC